MAALPGELVSLLEACKAEPDEDAPRWVLADWREGHGEEARAEFLGAQVRAASLLEGEPERVVLEVRALELLRRHGDEWQAHEPGAKATWERGFRRTTLGQEQLKAGVLRRWVESPAWPWVEHLAISIPARTSSFP